MKPPQRKTDVIKPVLPAIDFIAKTIRLPNNRVIKGVDVYTHCKIVGLVARELVKRMPLWLQEQHFTPGSELIAAVHDIGKISPGFQKKIYQNIPIGESLGVKALHRIPSDLDKRVGYHFSVSKAALDGCISKIIGRDLILEIVGRHHGVSSGGSGLPDDENYGGRVWQEARERVVYELKQYFNADWPEVVSDFHADLLSGLTTVSDWIGSGKDFEKPDVKDAPTGKFSTLISDALDRAGFIPPQIRKGLSFTDLFPPYSPHPLQKKMIEAVTGPGVYVLEAPMGIGKTEAALFAAYKVLEQNRASGIYFALPTQLTSNKMVQRMNLFLEKILEPDSSHRSSLLLHGTAWLTQTDMGEEGQPGRSWFDYRKRGLLAPFAVGTIDQALMAVMNVRHGFVRTFGLAGKVVILDEVHCYDAYTGTIIDYLVRALRAIDCTVIILSATLSVNRRMAILGIPENTPSTGTALSVQTADSQPTPEEFAYPLISALPLSSRSTSACQHKSDSQFRSGYTLKDEVIYFSVPAVEEPDIIISVCEQDSLATEEALLRSERGELVLWLENSVDEAQEQLRLIGSRASEIGVECGLIHSRFTRTDRATNEGCWVEVYGKKGRKKRGKAGAILVGTQVLEQSLDIDGDFLISRIAPTDMLLQRMGRLWRHRENDPLRPEQARREAWILSPSLEDIIQNPAKTGNSCYVYAPYVLCRTLEVWINENKVRLTGEKIRELIEATYSERTELSPMSSYKHEIEKTRNILGRLAKVGLSRGGVTLPESKATTRYSEIESVDVLLIRKKWHGEEGTSVRLNDGSTWLLSRDIQLRNRKVWQEIAVALQKNCVTVPAKMAPLYVDIEMKFLKNFVYLGDERCGSFNEEDDRPFRAALVKESGTIVGFGQRDASDEYHLHYDSLVGYVAEKKEVLK